jgi:hypothetical protein
MAQLSYQHLVDIDPDTGAYVQGWARISKSIITILTTPIGTRLMREWWGSSFRDMLDKPMNMETMVQGIIAAVEAINQYEPEFKVTTLTVDSASSDGSIQFTIGGTDLVDQANRQLTATL